MKPNRCTSINLRLPSLSTIYANKSPSSWLRLPSILFYNCMLQFMHRLYYNTSIQENPSNYQNLSWSTQAKLTACSLIKHVQWLKITLKSHENWKNTSKLRRTQTQIKIKRLHGILGESRKVIENDVFCPKVLLLRIVRRTSYI